MSIKPKSKVRLSKQILPLKYKLRIQPDMEAFTFSGEEAIEILLEKSVKEITLHSKDLEVTDGWWQNGKTRIDILKTSYNVKSETATFKFAKALPKGKGKLFLHFRGIISEKLSGFYRSQYQFEGKTMKIATTQFESTDARRAFPCFDEPSHKAIFEVSLVVPKHLTAISNTFESGTPKSLPHLPGYKVVKFAPTPKMSTYLLAYVIGDFEYIEGKTKAKKGEKSVRIRIYTPLGKKYQATFALETAMKTLEFLNDYFKIPYPLPVLDLIAMPDFSAGAMENWGAITFRETALLVDAKNSSFSGKQNVAYTIAHELVHQWFGNLVTMEWWTHLWLNESFATFMGFIALDEIFPEWHIWTKFVMSDQASAFHEDSLKNTHPIEVEVHHPDQIAEIFDAISYQKGGSVLRMLLHYIGPENFRNGLSYYLKKHSYKNTESIHLWEAFEKVSGKPVRKFMAKWVGEEGYPFVAVTEDKKDVLSISQDRFSLIGVKNKNLWPIPLQFELGKGELSDLKLFASKSHKMELPASSQYVKANPNETGFYRTIYSPSLLAKLYAPIKNKELSVTDRFGIVRDLFAAAKAGLVPTSAYLEFIQAYTEEDSYIVWTEILSGMGEISNIVNDNQKLKAKLHSYYLKIMKPVVELVGWEQQHKETQTRALLRSTVLAKYGAYGDKSVINKAEELLSKHSKKPIKPDLRGAVYYLAALGGKEATHKLLEKMYIGEGLSEEQRRIGSGLAAFKNKTLYKKTLNFSLSKNVRSQDSPLLIAACLNNPTNRNLAWSWIKQNWPELHKRYQGGHLEGRIIEYLTGFTDTKFSKDIQGFYKKNTVPAAERTIKQVIEQINLQADWKKRDLKDIQNFPRTNK